MDPEAFVASRLTRGNLIFPTRIVVSDHAVMRRKRSWLTVREESINLRNIGTVNINTGILWSDIRIESSGGSDPIESHGHTKSDARRIKELIESRQVQLLGAAPDIAGPTIACPHCAETIKAAARLCRFCGRDVNIRSS